MASPLTEPTLVDVVRLPQSTLVSMKISMRAANTPPATLPAMPRTNLIMTRSEALETERKKSHNVKRDNTKPQAGPGAAVVDRPVRARYCPVKSCNDLAV